MDLTDLEAQRQTLEANLQKLRQNLKHWHAWEAEYEGLKEELLAPAKDLAASDLINIAETYAGDLVNEKEIRELAGLDRDSPRSASQIIGLIERRQDYVQKNIMTLQRQFFDAEAKQEELAFAAASQTGDEDAEVGLPLTEIYEELDEEGNVLSSTLSRPEESTAKIVESLRNAGVSDDELKGVPGGKPKAEELKPAITNASSPITSPSATSFDSTDMFDTPVSAAATRNKDDTPTRPSVRKKSVSFTADTKTPLEAARSESEEGRKTVSFAEKVAVMPAAPPPDSRVVSFSPQVEEIPAQEASPLLAPTSQSEEQKKLRESFKPGEKVVKLNEDDEIEEIKVVLPEDESPEDAQTRREMLEYTLNEVGNVVAQIDLDEAIARDGANVDDEDDADSYHTTSEYLDDEDTPYTTGISDSEDEDEDEHGRNKRRVLTDEYIQEMKALEKQLIGNLGPALEDGSLIGGEEVNIDPEDMRKLVIRDKANSTSSVASDSSEKKPPSATNKKRVSFASELDVAEEQQPLPAQKQQSSSPALPKSEEKLATIPVADSIAERPAGNTSAALAAPPQPPSTDPSKTSRFKNSRAIATSDESSENDLPRSPGTFTGAAGTILAPTLTERLPGNSHSATSAPDPDQPDALMQRRELAAEYYRKRNEIVRAQGGFRADADQDEEEDPGELWEEREDGGGKRKISRFRAARLKGGM